MKFWVFIVLSTLLIPAVMAICGFIFSKKAPKSVNYIFGYRTARSMKNQNTWKFAHKLLGRIWAKTGIVLLPVALIPMLFVIGKGEETVGNVGMAVLLFQVVVLLITIIPVEKALKNNFDKDGNKIV